MESSKINIRWKSNNVPFTNNTLLVPPSYLLYYLLFIITIIMVCFFLCLFMIIFAILFEMKMNASMIVETDGKIMPGRR